MMGGAIRELCMLSVLGGFLLCLCPEGRPKRIAEMLFSVLLVSLMLGAARNADWDMLAFAGSADEREAEITESTDAAKERLERLVIEEQYRAYILNKAEGLGAEISLVELEVRRDESGIWTPWAIRIRGDIGQQLKIELAEFFTEELGIAYERQEWD